MRHFKMQKWIKKINAQRLAAMFVASLMLPVLILICTEKNPFWTSVVCVMMPLGGYTLFASLARRSGVMVWLGLPLVFFSSFQIVLSYLFGNSVVASDMFLNLLTTNPDEASELLANIYPAVIAVMLIYVPLLWLATEHIRRRVLLRSQVRLKMAAVGSATFMLACLVLVYGCKRDIKHVVRDELFPINVTYTTPRIFVR